MARRRPLVSRHIFLSYSRIDKQAVQPLLKGLERLRHVVWLDEQLEGGQQWWDEVLAQLRGCDVVIVGVSEAMLDSDACKAELRYAQALGKPVLPVALQTVNADLLPSHLARLQLVDFTSANAQAPFDLMAALERLPAPPPLPDPLPDPPTVPISYLSGLGELVHEPTLSLEQQYTVIQKLRAGLYRPRDREGVIGLMNGMREREDLYVSSSRALEEAFDEAARTAPPPVDAHPLASTAPAASSGAPATAPTPAAAYFASAPPPAAAAPLTPPAPPARRGRSRRTVLIALGVAVLLAVVGGVAVALSGHGGTPPVGAVGDACLVGSWRSTAVDLGATSGGTTQGGAGLALEITNEGAASYDFSSMEPVVVTSGSDESKVEFSGQLQTTIAAPTHGTANETVVGGSASFQAYVNGTAQGTPQTVTDNLFDQYTCDSTTLKVTSGSDVLTFERQ